MGNDSLQAYYLCENHKRRWFRFLVAGDDSVYSLLHAIINENIIERLNRGIMFSREDLAIIKSNTSKYIILQMNHHDVTIHSVRTGHDWVIVSNYSGPECYILHRHSGKDPYHRQQGHFKSLKDALDYIDRHEDWFADRH